MLTSSDSVIQWIERITEPKTREGVAGASPYVVRGLTSPPPSPACGGGAGNKRSEHVGRPFLRLQWVHPEMQTVRTAPLFAAVQDFLGRWASSQSEVLSTTR